MTLVDRIAALLDERGPMSACAIAIELGRRKADVLAALRDPRFERQGAGRSSRWVVSSIPSFDAGTLVALHPTWTQEWADEVVHWLLDRGFATSVNGNGTVRVSELGRSESESWIAAAVNR